MELPVVSLRYVTHPVLGAGGHGPCSLKFHSLGAGRCIRQRGQSCLVHSVMGGGWGCRRSEGGTCAPEQHVVCVHVCACV